MDISFSPDININMHQRCFKISKTIKIKLTRTINNNKNNLKQEKLLRICK